MKENSFKEDLHAPPASGAMPPNEEQIQSWLISNISAVVEVDPQTIDIRKPLEYYGMDSMQAMHLSGDLEDWLGRQLSPTVVWDYPTIELLARHLAENG
ncbi:MAG TPA: acyl carrier protein [Pyrinomonadaceae bacterium]